MTLLEAIKKFVKSFFRLFKLDVKMYNVHNSEEVLIQAVLTHFGIKTVLDVGANTGQYALALIHNGFKGKIISFEPISSVFSDLQKNASQYPQWTVINSGIGSADKKLTINVSENFASSSFLGVTRASLEAEPKTKFIRAEEVELTSLDNFVAKSNLPQQPILLKLDVQGFELEALNGALSTLKQIAVVQSELSFEPLYEGAPLYDDIISFMKKNGFDVFTIIPGFRNRSSGQMLQADGIFYRKNEGAK